MTERRQRHLVSNLTWGDRCRCCYDPNSDGGEYRALIEACEILHKEKEDEKEEPEEEEAAKTRATMSLIISWMRTCLVTMEV
jgi:hypothetical protein